jgi:hypothetical protein
MDSIWLFCNTLVCIATVQLTPMGGWVMSKLVLCCDINKFKILATKELSDFGRLFSCFQCQFKSQMGWDQPWIFLKILHWKDLVNYQLLNIRRTLTLPILFYMNFHMWKTNAKVCKILVIVFSICGKRRGGQNWVEEENPILLFCTYLQIKCSFFQTLIEVI